MPVKRGMMKNKQGYLALGIFIFSVISLVFIVSADTDLGVGCSADADCARIPDCSAGECQCLPGRGGVRSCFLIEEGDGGGGGEEPPPGDDVDVRLPPQNNNVTNNISNETAARRAEAAAATALNAQVLSLQQQIAALQAQQQGTANASTTLQQSITILQGSVSAIQATVTQHSSSIQTIQAQLAQIEQNKKAIESEQQARATGQASLQKSIDVAQKDLETVEEGLEKEQNFTKLIKYAFFILLAVAVALIVAYYMTSKKGSKKVVNEQIVGYINKQIKMGKKFPFIKESLVKAGWSEQAIQAAYKETEKRNYQNYLQKGESQEPAAAKPSSSSKSRPLHQHRSKIVAITVFSLIVLIGLLFLLKGVTTGKAIHFDSAAGLDTAFMEALEERIIENEFYPLVSSGVFCVQVKDEELSSSYMVFKTPEEHVVLPAARQCDEGGKFDFAVKFLNWESFDFLVNDLSCMNINLINTQRRNVVILPSRYVLRGFQLDPEQDYSQYCEIMNVLSNECKALPFFDPLSEEVC